MERGDGCRGVKTVTQSFSVERELRAIARYGSTAYKNAAQNLLSVRRAIACYGSTVGISVAQNLFGGGEEQKRDNAGGIIPLSVL